MATMIPDSPLVTNMDPAEARRQAKDKRAREIRESGEGMTRPIPKPGKIAEALKIEAERAKEFEKEKPSENVMTSEDVSQVEPQKQTTPRLPENPTDPEDPAYVVSRAEMASDPSSGAGESVNDRDIMKQIDGMFPELTKNLASFVVNPGATLLSAVGQKVSDLAEAGIKTEMGKHVRIGDNELDPILAPVHEKDEDVAVEALLEAGLTPNTAGVVRMKDDAGMVSYFYSKPAAKTSEDVERQKYSRLRSMIDEEMGVREDMFRRQERDMRRIRSNKIGHIQSFLRFSSDPNARQAALSAMLGVEEDYGRAMMAIDGSRQNMYDGAYRVLQAQYSRTAGRTPEEQMAIDNNRYQHRAMLEGIKRENTVHIDALRSKAKTLGIMTNDKFKAKLDFIETLMDVRYSEDWMGFPAEYRKEVTDKIKELEGSVNEDIANATLKKEKTQKQLDEAGINKSEGTPLADAANKEEDPMAGLGKKAKKSDDYLEWRRGQIRQNFVPIKGGLGSKLSQMPQQGRAEFNKAIRSALGSGRASTQREAIKKNLTGRYLVIDPNSKNVSVQEQLSGMKKVFDYVGKNMRVRMTSEGQDSEQFKNLISGYKKIIDNVGGEGELEVVMVHGIPYMYSTHPDKKNKPKYKSRFEKGLTDEELREYEFIQELAGMEEQEDM